MAPKKKAGRPSTFTPAIQEQIVSLIRVGNYSQVAAQAAGIPERTFYSWLERGEKETGTQYAVFLQAVKSAEATAEVEAVATIKGREPAWQAAAWYLERKHWQRWCQRKPKEDEEKREPIEIMVRDYSTPTPDGKPE